MSSRRKSREIALQILYQMEFDSALTSESGLKLFSSHFEQDPSDIEYTRKIVEGVRETKSVIDDRIQKSAKNWKLDRISHVDRNILRISIYEILNLQKEVPPHASINEAIEIAKKFGTEDSSSFINGVLDHISKSL